MTCSKRNTRNPLLLAVAISVTLGTTACLPSHKDSGNPGPAAGSVLASVGGISETDIKRPDLGFFLICNTGVKVKGDVTTDGDKEVVRFSGNQVKDGDSCTMEIRAEVKDDNYVWFGYENGQPVKGLLYGSDEQKVDAKKLKLQLYKLYSIKAEDTFAVAANVDFDLADAALTPADGKTSASLVCGATEQYPGTYKKTADKQATLTFENLKAKDFAAKTCDRLVVLVDKKEAFGGPAADLIIKAPKKGDVLKYPAAADRRYTLKAPVPGDGIGVDATVGDAECLRYEGPTPESTTKRCVDVRSVALTSAKSYLVAKVEGLDAQGMKVTYLAVPGESDTKTFEGHALTIEMIRAAVAKVATDAQKKAFHFYKESAAKVLMPEYFDEHARLAAEAADDKVALADLGSVRFLNVASVSVHGFHEVAPAVLAAAPGRVYWMATMKATKDGQKDLEFTLTGADNYFSSPKTPNFAAFVADMALANEDDSWRVYAAKGAALAPAACALDSVSEPENARTASELMMPDDLALEACRVKKDTLRALSLDTYKLTTTTYVWGWHEAP